MFSGIIETIGMVRAIEVLNDCMHFTIVIAKELSDLKIGDSISVNGVCLTITHFSSDSFVVAAVPETLRITTLSHLSIGSLVNIERSLQAIGRIGGHYVQGHVDGVGEIVDMNPVGDAMLTKITTPHAMQKYIVNKGYIALDGMSITVIEATSSWFSVTFIPHTLQITIGNQYQKGTRVNLEVDMFAKYVEKLLGVQQYATSHQTSQASYK